MAERTNDFSSGTEGSARHADRARGDDDTTAIRADISDTRDRMSHTLDEIGERLNPHVLKEQVRDNIREATDQVKDNVREATIGRVEDMARNTADRVRETRHDLADTIRQNPIPAAMVGIGLGWLVWNGRREGSGQTSEGSYRGWSGDQYVGGRSDAGGMAYAGGAGYAGDTGYAGSTGSADSHAAYGTEGEQGTVDRVRDKAEGLAEGAKGAASRVADRAEGLAGTVAQRTRQQARRVEDHFFENPLLGGAVTLAIGLAVGLAVPGTEREAAFMGDARDQVVDKARDVARDTKDKVETVAGRVVDEAQTTAKQEAHNEGLTA